MIQLLGQLFPGVSTLFASGPAIGTARLGLIALGALLAYLGFQRKLEPLIMVPMGLGMLAVNAGILFLDGGAVGNLILDPMAVGTDGVLAAMQSHFLQPVFSLGFGNDLIACLVFLGIGARSEISYLLARPWPSIIIALFAELGTFAALVLGVLAFGLTPQQAAAVAAIGGADGPMVLFAATMLAKEYFVPISIIAYLYLSLTYGLYPKLIRLMVPARYRGIDMELEIPEVPRRSKFLFILAACGTLCLLLPVAAPLMLSFFLGMAIKEADIGPYQELLENGVTYLSTLLLGLLLGTLCEASVILDPAVLKILALGLLALGISAVGGLLGGWVMYLVHRRQFNPLIGIAGVSCVPTTAKLAQQAAQEENPFCMILGFAMGANISGVITSAIAVGVFVATIGLAVR